MARHTAGRNTGRRTMSLKLVLISPTGTLVEDGKLSTPLVTQLCGVIERLGAAGVRFAIWSNKRWTIKGGTTTLQEYVSERPKSPLHYVDTGPPPPSPP